MVRSEQCVRLSFWFMDTEGEEVEIKGDFLIGERERVVLGMEFLWGAGGRVEFTGDGERKEGSVLVLGDRRVKLERVEKRGEGMRDRSLS